MNDRDTEGGGLNSKASGGTTHGAVALVWSAVLRGLYESRYRPGQRLTEAELTRDFGVSRSSVREALSRLAAEGVVTVHRHRGATIRMADTGELFDALEMLRLMAGYAARTAALRISKEANVDIAKAALDAVRAVKHDVAAFELAREQNSFYRTLILLAGNSELQRLLPSLHIHYLRILLNNAQPAEAIMSDYKAILEAILSGNPFDAERNMREHVDRHITMLRLIAEKGGD